MVFETESITIANRAIFVANIAKVNGSASRCFEDQTSVVARREGSNIHVDLFAPEAANHQEISQHLNRVGRNCHLAIADLGHLWSIDTNKQVVA